MDDSSPLINALWIWILLAFVLVPVQLFVSAPYGRHNRSGWGPRIDNRTGWTIMESMALIALWSVCLVSLTEWLPVVVLALILWSFHYVYRAFIYPWRTRTRRKQMPLIIVALAGVFNLINGGWNGLFLGLGWVQEGTGQLLSWRTLVGTGLFAAGWAMNFRADNRLLALRGRGESGYRIPQGGLFRYVSCPNFLGELIIWSGFAVLCWNLAAFAFVIWSAANLIPRALAHHRWYRVTFADYPRERRAIIPFLL